MQIIYSVLNDINIHVRYSIHCYICSLSCHTYSKMYNLYSNNKFDLMLGLFLGYFSIYRLLISVFILDCTFKITNNVACNLDNGIIERRYFIKFDV